MRFLLAMLGWLFAAAAFGQPNSSTFFLDYAEPVTLVDPQGLARFGRVELGAEFAITFETQFLPGEDANRYRELGANWGRALHDALVSAPRQAAADSPAE